MIKAILLDCFGVLVGRGFEETYRTAGGDPEKDRDFIDDLLGQGNLGIITQAEFHTAMAKQLGISETEWQATLQKVEQPNLELLTYAKQLRQHYKIAVLSNANRNLIDYLEEKIGKELLHECFDEIIVSAEIGFVKPEPEIYTYAAEKLGVHPQECVFVDDHDTLTAGAKAVGMHTIEYLDFVQMKTELEKLLSQSETSVAS